VAPAARRRHVLAGGPKVALSLSGVLQAPGEWQLATVQKHSLEEVNPGD